MTSLRERKKARTRAAIQRAALRLFREQGYEATSVEQIADAADTSPSTVFRYFAGKPELVTFDELDVLIAEAVHAQPSSLGALEALRGAFREVFGALSAEELAAKREQQALVLSVPELWGASLGNLDRTRRTITELVADRSGANADDPAVRACAGAVFGVLLTIWFDWAANPTLDAPAALDAALARLAAGV